jgi:hypothetical protein
MKIIDIKKCLSTLMLKSITSQYHAPNFIKIPTVLKRDNDVLGTEDQKKAGYHFDRHLNIQLICVWKIPNKY